MHIITPHSFLTAGLLPLVPDQGVGPPHLLISQRLSVSPGRDVGVRVLGGQTSQTQQLGHGPRELKHESWIWNMKINNLGRLE